MFNHRITTTSKERTIPLPRPLPVYILYATAWVDRNRDLQLREEIYKLDELVAKAISVPGVYTPTVCLGGANKIRRSLATVQVHPQANSIHD